MYLNDEKSRRIEQTVPAVSNGLKDKLLAKAEVLLSLSSAKLYDDELKEQIDDLINQIKGL